MNYNNNNVLIESYETLCQCYDDSQCGIIDDCLYYVLSPWMAKELDNSKVVQCSDITDFPRARGLYNYNFAIYDGRLYRLVGVSDNLWQADDDVQFLAAFDAAMEDVDSNFRIPADEEDLTTRGFHRAYRSRVFAVQARSLHHAIARCGLCAAMEMGLLD